MRSGQTTSELASGRPKVLAPEAAAEVLGGILGALDVKYLYPGSRTTELVLRSNGKGWLVWQACGSRAQAVESCEAEAAPAAGQLIRRGFAVARGQAGSPGHSSVAVFARASWGDLLCLRGPVNRLVFSTLLPC